MAVISFKSQPLDRAYRVTDTFSKVSSLRSSPHSGIDLAMSDRKPANIYCVDDGTVIVSKLQADGKGYGYYTVVAHDGYCTLYAHMKGNNFKVGDKVKAGDVLGEMGNTGHSTGTHLHLEVRIGDANDWGTYSRLPKDDPAKYLAGGSYAIEKEISDSSTGSSTVSGAATAEDAIDYASEAIGQMVSMLTPQPIHAFIKIFLGDDLVLLSTDPAKPNIIQNFEYTRYEGVGEEASFTLFDTNWDDIEYYLAKNHDRVYIQYGYYGMEGKKNYPIRKHRLSDYSLAFVDTGVLLTVSTITEGAYQNLTQTTVTVDKDYYNPTEFVKAVGKQLGWIIRDENFDPSEDVVADNPFNIREDLPVRYIMEEVVPLASNQNDELFYFYLDSENVAYFKRYRTTTSNLSKVKTYIYQKGYDSVVKDLTFDIKGVFGGTSSFSTATGLRGSTIDPTAKTQDFYKLNSDLVTTISYGESTDTASNQSIPNIDAAGDTSDQMKRRLYYYLKSSIDAQYTAHMTIVGDPTIELLEDVRIINLTDSGNLHHTSGVYWVKGINDSIAGGELITTLELARNARASLDGIELLNPKYLIK